MIKETIDRLWLEICEENQENFDTVIQYVQSAIINLKKYLTVLPIDIRNLLQVLLILSAIGVALSYALAIVRCRKVREPNPKSNLFFGYFSGTAKLRRKCIYVEANRLLLDKTWDYASTAFWAYRLGNVKLKSHILMFPISFVYIPLAILGSVEMLARIVTGIIVLRFARIVHASITMVCHIMLTIIARPLVTLLDRVLQIAQHCPRCFDTTPSLNYRCPQCGTIHDDLAPGNCGVLWARCKCGKLLPASVISGRDRLEAYCPKCGDVLPAANARQISIQLLGGNATGKTTFLSAFQRQYLRKDGGEKTQVLGFPKDELAVLNKEYDSGTIPDSISIAAYSFVHCTRRGKKDNLILYDVPDEQLLAARHEKNLLQFEYSDGFAVFIDAESLDAVQKASRAEGIKLTCDLEESFEDVVTQFVDMHSRIIARSSQKMIETPVAVLISKCDNKIVKRQIGYPKIRSIFNANEQKYNNNFCNARNTICREFLVQSGLENAINILESVFVNVNYFPVSALGYSGNDTVFSPWGILEPILWLVQNKNKTIERTLKTALMS